MSSLRPRAEEVYPGLAPWLGEIRKRNPEIGEEDLHSIVDEVLPQIHQQAKSQLGLDDATAREAVQREVFGTGPAYKPSVPERIGALQSKVGDFLAPLGEAAFTLPSWAPENPFAAGGVRPSTVRTFAQEQGARPQQVRQLQQAAGAVPRVAGEEAARFGSLGLAGPSVLSTTGNPMIDMWAKMAGGGVGALGPQSFMELGSIPGLAQGAAFVPPSVQYDPSQSPLQNAGQNKLAIALGLIPGLAEGGIAAARGLSPELDILGSMRGLGEDFTPMGRAPGAMSEFRPPIGPAVAPGFQFNPQSLDIEPAVAPQMHQGMLPLERRTQFSQFEPQGSLPFGFTPPYETGGYGAIRPDLSTLLPELQQPAAPVVERAPGIFGEPFPEGMPTGDIESVPIRRGYRGPALEPGIPGGPTFADFGATRTAPETLELTAPKQITPSMITPEEEAAAMAATKSRAMNATEIRGEATKAHLALTEEEVASLEGRPVAAVQKFINDRIKELDATAAAAPKAPPVAPAPPRTVEEALGRAAAGEDLLQHLKSDSKGTPFKIDNIFQIRNWRKKGSNAVIEEALAITHPSEYANLQSHFAETLVNTAGRAKKIADRVTPAEVVEQEARLVQARTGLEAHSRALLKAGGFQIADDLPITGVRSQLEAMAQKSPLPQEAAQAAEAVAAWHNSQRAQLTLANFKAKQAQAGWKAFLSEEEEGSLDVTRELELLGNTVRATVDIAKKIGPFALDTISYSGFAPEDLQQIIRGDLGRGGRAEMMLAARAAANQGQFVDGALLAKNLRVHTDNLFQHIANYLDDPANSKAFTRWWGKDINVKAGREFGVLADREIPLSLRNMLDEFVAHHKGLGENILSIPGGLYKGGMTKYNFGSHFGQLLDQHLNQMWLRNSWWNPNNAPHYWVAAKAWLNETNDPLFSAALRKGVIGGYARASEMQDFEKFREAVESALQNPGKYRTFFDFAKEINQKVGKGYDIWDTVTKLAAFSKYTHRTESAFTGFAAPLEPVLRNPLRGEFGNPLRIFGGGAAKPMSDDAAAIMLNRLTPNFAERSKLLQLMSKDWNPLSIANPFLTFQWKSFANMSNGFRYAPLETVLLAGAMYRGGKYAQEHAARWKQDYERAPQRFLFQAPGMSFALDYTNRIPLSSLLLVSRPWLTRESMSTPDKLISGTTDVATNMFLSGPFSSLNPFNAKSRAAQLAQSPSQSALETVQETLLPPVARTRSMMRYYNNPENTLIDTVAKYGLSTPIVREKPSDKTRALGALRSSQKDFKSARAIIWGRYMRDSKQKNADLEALRAQRDADLKRLEQESLDDLRERLGR